MGMWVEYYFCLFCVLGRGLFLGFYGLEVGVEIFFCFLFVCFISGD